MSQHVSSTSLAGRAALVTGAGVGIGRAITEALAGAGAFVGLHCHRSLAGAEEALAGIRQRGGNGVVLQADLADADQASALVEQFVKAAGRCDILVNTPAPPCSARGWRIARWNSGSRPSP